MKLFVGLDVSLAKTAVCVISEHGKVIKEAQVPSDPQGIVDWAGSGLYVASPFLHRRFARFWPLAKQYNRA